MDDEMNMENDSARNEANELLDAMRESYWHWRCQNFNSLEEWYGRNEFDG